MKITKRLHTYLHKKIIKKYGNASKCENEECQHKYPKRYEWALKKEREYSDDPNDYLQLCPSCHRKYDLTDEARSNMSKRKVGQNNNKAKLKDSDILEISQLFKSGVTQKKIAERFNLNPSTISDIKRGKRWPHLNHLFKQHNL